MERLILAVSIAMGVLAIAHPIAITVASSRTRAPAAPVVAERPLDAPALEKRIAELSARLRDAQTRMDEVLLQMTSPRDDAERDATRVRLDVLHRLERGLVADLTRARSELARVSVR